MSRTQVATDLPRKTAFEILLRFEKGGAGHFKTRLKAENLIQDAIASQSDWGDADRGFIHALVMGTLRHWLKLDEWIRILTGRPLKQITPPVRVLLRLGLFQLYGLAHVPAYAAINSTVELTKERKFSPKTVKFINAVLREAQRRLEAGGFEVPAADQDFPQHLLMTCGWPEAWTSLLEQQYDRVSILDMARVSEEPSRLFVRVNTLKTSPETYRAQLEQAGLTAGVSDASQPESLWIEGFSGSPRHLPGYEEGLFYVQDPASVWVSRFLAPQPGERVLDLCAAPGSKTTHLAALMENSGGITAVEPKKDRLQRLQENLFRLGVSNVEALQADGLTFEPTEGVLYDRVLVDAPCSGTGTLRKHPEIILQLKKPDFTEYRKLQQALLEKGFSCLKPGGVLVYSTCSIVQTENQDVIAAFLAAHPEASLLSEEQRFITANSDGFYAARLEKS